MDSQLADKIRGAFAAGEFAKAQRFWSEYAGQLQRMITARTATAATMSETRELIDWSARVVKAHQAHAADRLRGLYLARIYGTGAYQG